MGNISPETLGRWFDAHAAGMVLYARQWLDAEEAADAVQDVFLKAAGLREPPVSEKAWLLAATRNAALNRLRSRRRRSARDAEAGRRRAGWLRGEEGSALDPDRVERLVAGLPDDQREVLVLRIWCRMTLREISGLLGRPVSTLFSQYRSALATLKDRMRRPCLTNPNNSTAANGSSRRP